jgi:hypothetical protein
MRKADVFEKYQEKRQKASKQIFFALITTSGVKPSLWTEELVQQQVTLGDLFA